MITGPGGNQMSPKPPHQQLAESFYSALPSDQQSLLRDVVRSLHKEGMLKLPSFNPHQFKLSEVLAHPNEEHGRQISDVTVGPGIYKPSNPHALGADCPLGSDEVCVTYSNTQPMSGSVIRCHFKRDANGELTLIGRKVLFKA